MGTIKEEFSKDIRKQKAAGRIDSSKYEQALAQYNLEISDDEVKAAVKKIIEEKVPENNNLEVKKFLFGSIEYTTLSVTDTEEKVLGMVEKINKFNEDYPELPHVAAICTYPNFTKLIADSLEVEGVEVANVSGAFPSSQTFLEVKTIETSLAIKDGATNIDIVLPVGSFFSGDYETVCDTISELKEVCGDADMKVILETGVLRNAKDIKIASLLSMYSGADFIKTSTGKEGGGASAEAVYVMCQAIKEYYDKTGIMVGLKPSGGINSAMDAIIYYTILKEVLGEKWATNYYFRLGTSRLTNLLLSEILGSEIKYF
ncbi:MAG: deoxyribose-phosphate aldolase [Prevotella bivia]|uniref:deoxyribose-phosphate aldolase n=1 Tax=Prevotella bivia TaxID=28125 RepID=UPI000660D77C|nr:deoxyribose-phosphate aldolase [Prevotella bivia]KXU57464.1 deoxyribose-phosphate aldolase [Prevotella bivia]MDK7763196.1 deoxyribose-phosphate aldolase [Prevotella bivia]MDU2113984.1 deoxyribose-phosphate aldolase [Prevotella bivia]MDU2328424.1 deoxyribose-phosphate aldolase [Prevotella bivia]MDU3908270.1 deoxyribose-phosphate aldolase [Prevotella bivia]